MGNKDQRIESPNDDQLFGKEFRAEIASILCLTNNSQLDKFSNELRAYGIKMRGIIRSIPNAFPISTIDASHTKRVEWLEDKVLTPSQKLITALQPENLPFFNLWPEDERMPHEIFNQSILIELSTLQANAARIISLLHEHIADGITPTSELRHDIVYNLVAIAREHFPEIHLSRGTYDKKLKQMIGRTPAYVRRGFLEITGAREQLDDPIAQALK